MRAHWLLVPLAVVSVGCSSSKDDETPRAARSTTTTTAVVTSTTATSRPPTLPAFEGATEPVDVPIGTEHTALLTKVDVEHASGVDRVTFQFRDPGVPGVHAEYVARPTADGSGAAVKVAGAAYLEIRLSPAAGADLTGETPVTTYSGPRRVPGDDAKAVTEVVRSGDFEGVLTWVIGVRSKAKFRVSTLPNPSRVVVELDAP